MTDRPWSSLASWEIRGRSDTLGAPRTGVRRALRMSAQRQRAHLAKSRRAKAPKRPPSLAARQALILFGFDFFAQPKP